MEPVVAAIGRTADARHTVIAPMLGTAAYVAFDTMPFRLYSFTI